jgi:hypothetical protein
MVYLIKTAISAACFAWRPIADGLMKKWMRVGQEQLAALLAQSSANKRSALVSESKSGKIGNEINGKGDAA